MPKRRKHENAMTLKKQVLQDFAPLLVFDMMAVHCATRSLPFMLCRGLYRDMWHYLQDEDHVKCYAHWFCNGPMHSRQRISQRYDDFYLTPPVGMFLTSAISGYQPCSKIPFLWEKSYKCDGNERIGLVLDVPSVLKQVFFKVSTHTTITTLSVVQMVVEYLLPQSIFLSVPPHWARSVLHCSQFFIGTESFRWTRNVMHVCKHAQEFLLVHGKSLQNDMIQTYNAKTWYSIVNILSNKLQFYQCQHIILVFGKWIERYASTFAASWWRSDNNFFESLSSSSSSITHG